MLDFCLTASVIETQPFLESRMKRRKKKKKKKTRPTQEAPTWARSTDISSLAFPSPDLFPSPRSAPGNLERINSLINRDPDDH